MTHYILTLLIGFLMMWFKTIDSARRKPDFNWKIFFDLNMFKIAFGIAAAAVCSLSLDYFFGIFNMPGLNYFIAFAVGFSSSALVNEFLKIFRKRIKFTDDEEN